MGAASSDLALRPEEVAHLQDISSFTKSDIKKLYRRFVKLDSKARGAISKDDLMRIPEFAMNPLVDRIVDVFGFVDKDRMNFTEFVECLAVFNDQASSDAKLRISFAIFDINRDGYVSHTELIEILRKLVGKHISDEELQKIADLTILDADRDGDGKLSFEEFQTSVLTTSLFSTMTLDPLDKQ